MMKKLFGEHLVEKGLVSSKDIVEALIEQTKKTPSVAQIVFEKELLDSETIFKIFSHQGRTGLEFKSASEALGLWSTELSASVDKELKQLRVPLGQILVQKGCLDFEAMTAALDDFLGGMSPEEMLKKEAPTAAPTPAAAPVAEAAPPPPAPAPAKNSAEFAELSDALLAEVEENFTEAKKSELLTNLKEMGDGSNESGNEKLKKTLHDVHQLKGVATFAQLAKVVELLAKTESLLEPAVANYAALEASDVKTVGFIALKSIELVFQFTKSVASERSEKGFFEKMKQPYHSHLSLVGEMTDKVRNLNDREAA